MLKAFVTDISMLTSETETIAMVETSLMFENGRPRPRLTLSASTRLAASDTASTLRDRLEKNLEFQWNLTLGRTDGASIVWVWLTDKPQMLNL